MAVLPTANLDLATGVTFQKQPSLTWFLDQASGRIRGTVDNLEAVRQGKALNTKTGGRSPGLLPLCLFGYPIR